MCAARLESLVEWGRHGGVGNVGGGVVTKEGENLGIDVKKGRDGGGVKRCG